MNYSDPVDNSNSSEKTINYNKLPTTWEEYAEMRRRYGYELPGVQTYYHPHGDSISDLPMLPYDPFLGLRIAMALLLVVLLFVSLVLYYRVRVRCNSWCDKRLDQWEAHRLRIRQERKKRKKKCEDQSITRPKASSTHQILDTVIVSTEPMDDSAIKPRTVTEQTTVNISSLSLNKNIV